MIGAVALTIVFLMSSSPTPAPSPSPGGIPEFFKEDHLTGADYLALYPSGKYEILGREHMGIFDLERGTWTRQGNVLALKPEKGLRSDSRLRAPYSGVWVTDGNDVFLVWSTADAAGIVVAEDDVRRLLKEERGYPPYVFFRVTENTFRCETGVTYPFRFHPEMNTQGQLKCEKQ